MFSWLGRINERYEDDKDDDDEDDEEDDDDMSQRRYPLSSFANRNHLGLSYTYICNFANTPTGYHWVVYFMRQIR